MTNSTPQLEDGFFRLANEIADNICRINLSSYQTRILFFILRKTYGFNKKDDWISVSQIVEATELHKAHVSRTKKELIMRGLVTSSGNKIAFQKDWRLWKKLPIQVTIKKVTNSGAKVTNSGEKLPVQADTIYTIQKTLTKDIISNFIPFFEKVNPSYTRLFSNKTERSALKRLITQYGEKRIKNLLLQLPSIIQRPYAPRITTPYQLEVKMGQLIAFMKQESIKINKGGVTKV